MVTWEAAAKGILSTRMHDLELGWASSQIKSYFKKCAFSF